jgi:hypothetical protein
MVAKTVELMAESKEKTMVFVKAGMKVEKLVGIAAYRMVD